MGRSQTGKLVKKFAEIRERVLKLSHNEDNVGMFWKLIFFPIDPQFYGYTKEEQKKLRKISDELLDSRLMKLATAKYPDDILELASGSPSPESGKYFDVVSLLSSVGGCDLVRNNGDRVALNTNTFKGKYILVCCFNVPEIIWAHHKLVVLCNELYSTRDDFEMVMVARMNTLANDHDVFHHFFSGFPKLCLAVPFEDNQRRDYICKVLDLGLDIDEDYNRYKFLFLDIQGKVETRLTKHYDYLLDYYGAEAFPFTVDVNYKSDLECREVVFGNVSLERILRCNESSPDFVYKINPRGRVEMPVSQLSAEFSNKHVGLYLCSKGDFLLDLLHMYEKCRAKNHDFEIVVVFLPFAKEIDPKIFEEKMNRLLKRHNVVGWWCLPFDNSVSRRFWRLTRHYDTENGEGGGYNGDKLIVTGPGVEHLDVYGACVIRQQGIDAFPFTIEAGIQQRMKELREMTLESLFGDGDVLFIRGNDRSDVISLKEVRGKTIFLFIDKLRAAGDDNGTDDYGRMVSFYVEKKATMEEVDSFEMVYVDVKRSTPPVLDDKERNKILSKMPWFVCPINGTNDANLDELLRLLNKGDCYDDYVFSSALVGFGEDGRIFSVEDFGSEHGRRREDIDLYYDAEQILGYDEYEDHQMQKFANPRDEYEGGSDMSYESASSGSDMSYDQSGSDQSGSDMSYESD